MARQNNYISKSGKKFLATTYQDFFSALYVTPLARIVSSRPARPSRPLAYDTDSLPPKGPFIIFQNIECVPSPSIAGPGRKGEGEEGGQMGVGQWVARAAVNVKVSIIRCRVL